MPDEPEVHGLLALMLLHDSRRDARLRDGELVLLADQDRARWDCGADRRAAAPRSTARIAPARPRAVRPAGGDRRAARRGAAATGSRSRRSTASSRDSPARRSSSSTARSRSPRPRGRRRRSRSSTRSTSTATTTCTPPAPSCCGGSAASDEARAAYERALELARAEPERRFLERRIDELSRR